MHHQRRFTNGERRLVHAVLDSWMVGAPHTDTIWLDDPELMVRPLRSQDRKNPDEHLKDHPSTGLSRSKHHNADILFRRIRTDVREIQVEREKHPRFSPAHRPDLGILRADQPFVANGVALPTGSAKKLGCLNRQVFVELRAHARILRRKR